MRAQERCRAARHGVALAASCVVAATQPPMAAADGETSVPSAGARPLLLHRVPEGLAACNDGSPPIYYLRDGDHRRFVLWLEGGFACYSEASCESRERWLTTSRGRPLTETRSGIFSTDELVNPLFWNATMVHVHYCSSDSWIGDRDEPLFGGGYYFQGQRIISAVVRELEAHHGLTEAGLLLFGGCSAGGRGALYNLDRVCGMLRNPATLCRGLSDAAWWVLPDGGTTLEQSAKDGVHAWNGSGAFARCAASQPAGAEHLCMFGPILAPHVRTPFMVQGSSWDTFQLGQNGIRGSAFFWSPRSWIRAREFRDAVRTTISQLPAQDVAFSATCLAHCLANEESFWKVKLASSRVSMEEALRRWLMQPANAEHVHLDGFGGLNSSQGCTDHWSFWRAVALFTVLVVSLRAFLKLGLICTTRLPLAKLQKVFYNMSRGRVPDELSDPFEPESSFERLALSTSREVRTTGAQMTRLGR